MRIELKGVASQTTRILTLKRHSNSLMDDLIATGVPIASSCSGELICKKCQVLTQGEACVLSCSLTTKQYIESFGNEIIVNYL